MCEWQGQVKLSYLCRNVSTKIYIYIGLFALLTLCARCLRHITFFKILLCNVSRPSVFS